MTFVPDLGDLLTLIVAVGSSGLAMIFPPLIHILTYWNQQQPLTIEGDLNGGVRSRRSQRSAASILPKPFWVVKDTAIMTLGVVGCAFSRST